MEITVMTDVSSATQISGGSRIPRGVRKIMHRPLMAEIPGGLR
jgi:hypothetical protein